MQPSESFPLPSSFPVKSPSSGMAEAVTAGLVLFPWGLALGGLVFPPGHRHRHLEAHICYWPHNLGDRPLSHSPPCAGPAW